jgi:type II secretory pathway predicted ATPase ExeA
VLVIDEAQNLSVDVLEQIRLLTNLETNERKLLQVILLGQPELATLLDRVLEEGADVGCSIQPLLPTHAPQT